MPLSDADRRAKYEREMELMAVQIDKGRLDIERVRQEMKWEGAKALAAITAGVAAVAGIILGLAHLLK